MFPAGVAVGVFKMPVSLAGWWQVTVPWAELGVQISYKHL